MLDGGEKPLFRVTASDAPSEPAVCESSSAAWTELLNRGRELRSKPPGAVSGPEKFGWTNEEIQRRVQALPGIDVCRAEGYAGWTIGEGKRKVRLKKKKGGV